MRAIVCISFPHFPCCADKLPKVFLNLITGAPFLISGPDTTGSRSKSCCIATSLFGLGLNAYCNAASSYPQGHECGDTRRNKGSLNLPPFIDACGRALCCSL